MRKFTVWILLAILAVACNSAQVVHSNVNNASNPQTEQSSSVQKQAESTQTNPDDTPTLQAVTPTPTQGQTAPPAPLAAESSPTPQAEGPTPIPEPIPAGLPGSDGLGDPYYPQLGNGGYDALHYTLDLAVDVESNTIAGTAIISIQASQNLSAFNLDFSGFEIGEVLINDAVANYGRQGHELTIIPPASLREGQTFTVTVAYSGEPNPIRSKALPIKMGWIHSDAGIYVASEPDGAASWYPVNDHPLDKATYTLRITVPEPYVVAANGLLEDKIEDGDNTTYVWEASHPMASYLTTVNIAE